MHRTHAFSLVELMVCVAILGIFAALAFPWLGSMRKMADASTCTNNLRQIGAATGLYVAEHSGRFPPLPGVPGGYWNTYTIWNNPGGERQWMYFGKLVEEGFLADGRVFYCPTALKGTFDYDSQWAQCVEGGTVKKGFRIGYMQRVADTEPVPGQLIIGDGKIHILMTDVFLAANYSQHPLADKNSAGQRWIHVLSSDGSVYADKSGNRWSHSPRGSLYEEWERNP